MSDKKYSDGFIPVSAKREAGTENPNTISPAVLEQKTGIILVPDGEIKEGDLLKITKIVSIFDLQDFIASESPVILSVSDAQIVRCALTFPTLFGKDYYVLDGVPGFEYDESFRSATWGLPTISYHALASDVAYARRVNEAASLAAQSTIGRERARVTRKSGKIRPFTDFEVKEGLSGDTGTAVEPPGEAGDDGQSEV